MAAKLEGDSSLLREVCLEEGASALRAGEAVRAYECIYRAGWDSVYHNDIAPLLEQLAEAADAAGSRALAALARLHAATITD